MRKVSKRIVALAVAAPLLLTVGCASQGDLDALRRRLAEIEADPRLKLGAPTFGWIHAALESIALTLESGWAEAIETPIVVCSATQDTVVPLAGHARFVERLPNAELVAQLSEGLLHAKHVEKEEADEGFYVDLVFKTDSEFKFAELARGATSVIERVALN